ncbi:MAG: efflux RND transporter periplasmic adaptor subunit [Elusimicrobia bacterium]|nr:efflux RND transporter periplasmic adaptor subunit [Elusimicrobiota bacterium]MDE2236436.1 efflux RND transporter periplasmic adaptor subunit [Elusimicrobiota bacterium]MDE2426406.1 efflux RND transporter periplasmic adaptor subunit [Elusimicrobiota bacterium]
MRARSKVSIVLLIAVAAAAALGLRRVLSRPEKPTAEAVAVRVGPIENTVDATGSVLPLNRVEVKPPISGRIEKLLVDEGQHVRAGQILAWMSSSDRAAILDAALAQGPQELKRWEDAYKPTPIVAPLSGVVILRNVVVGQTVDPSTVLYAMSDTLIVLAEVDESDVGRVHVGMPVRIVLDSYPDREVEGKVFDILYEGKNVSNVIQYGVKIKVQPVPSYFRSEMTANVSFIEQRKPKALLIPVAALKELPDGSKQVLIPGAPGQPPAARAIVTGIESGDSVEVLGGLSAGDTVLVARTRYVPQQGPQSSPLTFGVHHSNQSGRAPKPKSGS